MKRELKRYERYKDSGIEWLGEVPAGWEVKRLKEFANIVRGGSPRPAGDLRYYEGNIPFLKVGDLTKTESTYLEKHTHTINKEGLSSTRLVGAGTLMLTNSGATLGIPKICTFATTFNDGIAAFLGLKKHNQKFLFYLLKTKTQWYLNQAALGQGQPNLNTDIIGNTFFSCPSKQEQQAITAYLDEKTARIDRKIELLSQKADRYRELKQALINETVTRGLDPTVPMKDSGVDWIGEVPSHWEVKRLKDVFKPIKGKSLDLTVEKKEKYLPNLSLGYLRNNSNLNIDYSYTENNTLKASSQDIIIIWDGAGVGEILRAKEGFLSSTIAKLVFKDTVQKEFVFHLRRQLEVKLKNMSTGMGIPHLNPIILNNFMIPLPNEDDMNRIDDYLSDKTAQLEQIINTITTQIQTLQELRKTLINDVVIGKIKVV